MRFNYAMVKPVARGLLEVYKYTIEATDVEEIEGILNFHAIGAAASGMATGWIPGAGGTAALMASVGFIWSMYYRINRKLGITLSKNIVKSLGSAILTNLIGSALTIGGVVATATALSFTGLGNTFASVMMAALSYAVVLVSGIIYMKMLTGLFKAGLDINTMSTEELKSAAKNVMEKEDLDSMLKEAKNNYKKAYKSGKVTGKEKVDIDEL